MDTGGAKIQVLALLIIGLCHYLPSTGGVIYFVKPTTACHNTTISSCPFGEICPTLDEYVGNSKDFFSPDKENVTLCFMSGVHNQTYNKRVEIDSLHRFVMVSATGRLDAAIYMPIQGEDNVLRFYAFSNVSNVTIESISISFITMDVEGRSSVLHARNVVFQGSLSSSISAINLNGSRSLLSNCSFQNNVFIRLHSRSALFIKKCRFQSYKHELYSVIYVDNSTVTFFGMVYFINNILWNGYDNSSSPCGAAILSHAKSFLTLCDGAYVHFINNTSTSGGAMHLRQTVLEVGKRVSDPFHWSSPPSLDTQVHEGSDINSSIVSNIHLTAKASVHFDNNYAHHSGGAVFMWNSTIIINQNASMHFINNSALWHGGAIVADDNCQVSIDHGLLLFVNNSAQTGKAGALLININGVFNARDQANITFKNNTTTDNRGGGGALHATNSKLSLQTSTLLFADNSAQRGYGGAVALVTSHVIITEYANVSFINNDCTYQGGAIFLLSEGYLLVDKNSVLILTTTLQAKMEHCMYLHQLV